MTVRSSRAIAAALALALVAPSARAQSVDDKAAADRLFNDAKSLMARQDYDDACPKFAESNRLDQGIGVMLYLADCYEKQGKLASAWVTFRDARDLATRLSDPKRAEVAQAHADSIEPNLSMLTIMVDSTADVPDLAVTRNGSVVGKAQWGSAMPVDAGTQVITVSAPNHEKWQTTVHVAGDHARVTVAVPPLATTTLVPTPSATTTATTTPAATTPAPPTQPPSDTTSSSPGLGTRRIVAIGVAGAGVLGLIVGGVTGLSAKGKLDDSNADGHCVGDHCDATGTQARNDALSAATISTIAFVVGVAAIAGGAVLWFTAPKDNAPAVGLGGFTTGRDSALMLHGRF